MIVFAGGNAVDWCRSRDKTSMRSREGYTSLLLLQKMERYSVAIALVELGHIA
jgi:hypothetical protein